MWSAFRWFQTKTRAEAFTVFFPQRVNKSDLRDAILEKLRADLAQQTAAALLARDEAISEESRPENKYDMHSQEAAYLAEGQARLAKEIAQSIEVYTSLPLPEFPDGATIALGAVVKLSGSPDFAYLVGPRAGGLEVKVAGRDVLVITPQSPLGRELVGRRAGDAVRPPGAKADRRIAAVT